MEGELFDIVKNFIEENKITSSENIYRRDCLDFVIYELVEKLFETVGYYNEETQSYEE